MKFEIWNAVRRAISRVRPSEGFARAIFARRQPHSVTPPRPFRARPKSAARALSSADARFVARTHRGAAGSLSYKLYVPDAPQRANPALLLMLHGCGQDPDDFARGTRMNEVADELGFIVAYPRQSRLANPAGCWNWFDSRHQGRGAGEPAKLAELALALAREFGVDSERTFVAGLSAGGAMAEILARTYPDVFEAAGIHSGLPYRAARDALASFAAMQGDAPPPPAPPASDATRRIVLHGGADASVHPVNGERVLESAQRSRNPLRRTQTQWRIDSGEVRRTILSDADGRAKVEHWFVEGGGHAWFGGDSRGSYTEAVGLDASRVMARFFLKA